PTRTSRPASSERPPPHPRGGPLYGPLTRRGQRGSPSGMEAVAGRIRCESVCSTSPSHVSSDHRSVGILRANVKWFKSGWGGTVLLWGGPCPPYKLGHFFVPFSRILGLGNFRLPANWSTPVDSSVDVHQQFPPPSAPRRR